MSVVAQWLGDLGLGQYAQAFTEQDIDATVLPELTDADLQTLGVASLGHRKRILRAIAEQPPLAADAADTTPAPHPARTDAERRQLTVMFCDLVDSTALSRRLDPEDFREALRRYHACVAAATAPYEGYVAQYLGDGVLVYFGYPRAHEDDAARAVHAALAVVAAVETLAPTAGTPLRTRVGIATGPVVVAPVGDDSSATGLSATGETPNLAARLQGLAEPGQIVVAPRTQALIAAWFETQSLGPAALKGMDAPVEPWRVLRERSAASRFEAQHPQALADFIGREGEVALLLERWTMACDGEGQAVLLSGEAGIGKSRISQTLRERLDRQAHAAVLWQCSPYAGSSALHPVIEWLRRAAGIVAGEEADAQGARLTVALARRSIVIDEATLGYLLRLLGLPDGGRVSADLAPQQHKARTLDAIADLLAAIGRTQPLLCLVEDAHWIDPTSEELLALVVERLRGTPALVLVTARPEYAPGWAATGHVTRLPLSRLGQRQCAALVTAVAKGRTLPAVVVDEIVRKTDGIPLFAGELTLTVLQSGLLVETPAGYALAGPLSSLAIPSTLQDSLMARLDRLAAGKDVAQAGATIGREFTHRLIAEVMRLAPDKLDAALAELQRAELLSRRGVPPDATYVFKHALVRDAAYGSMVKAQRARLHGLIASAIEAVQPEVVTMQPELLAFHWQEAGQAERALDYWERAGDLAMSRSAGVEATAHFEAALRLLPHVTGRPGKTERELAIRHKLGASLHTSAGPSAPGYLDNAQRSLDLAHASGRTEDYLGTCVHFAAARFSQGRVNEVMERLDVVAKQADALSAVARVRFATLAGMGHMMLGSVAPALRLLESARVIDDAEPGTHLNMLAGRDPAIFLRSYLSRTLSLAGLLDQADA